MYIPPMGETTTVRVGRATRDHLNRVSAEANETVDTTIQRALRLLELEERRKQAEIESLALAKDPADRDEVRAAIRDLLGE
jgi:Ser-tRNA(Ala) deacylase AlaX